MGKKWFVLFFIIMTSIGIVFFGQAYDIPASVEQGVFDAQDSLHDTDAISLNGEWQFYPNEFVSPGSQEEDQVSPNYIQVPLMWNQLGKKEDVHYGTYRISLVNLVPGERYGLLKKNIRSACKIYVDGKLLLSDGVISNIKDDEIMGNTPTLISFTAEKQTEEIIIQVSNFEYYTGGISEPIKFGSIDSIMREHNRNIIFETAIFMTLFVTGILFIALITFFSEFRKNQITGLSFPITSISFAIVNGVIGEKILYTIFPTSSTAIYIRIGYIAISIFFITLLYSIHLMDAILLPRLWTRILGGGYLFILLSAIIMPLDYSYIWILHSVYTSIAIPGVFCFVLYKYLFSAGVKIDQEEHMLIVAILYCVIIYNVGIIFYLMGATNNVYVPLLAAASYSISWFILIAYKIHIYNVKLKDTEMELQVTNDELEVHQNQLRAAYEIMEMEVEDRTKELVNANERLHDEITKREKNEKEIERLAFYDQLTGIPNRRYFDEHFQKEIANAERYHHPFTVLFLDLDGFKGVNDNFGHDVGDKLLQKVGEILLNNVREGDLAARLGGDEFVIFLTHLETKEVIVRICTELIERISAKMNILGHEVQIGVSIGIVSFPIDGIDKELLIKKADSAMYVAKKSKTNKFVFAERI